MVWVRYCQWRRFRKSQYGKADFYFRQRALPRYDTSDIIVILATFFPNLVLSTLNDFESIVTKLGHYYMLLI